MLSLMRLYGDCLKRTGRALARSPWTALLPVLYAAVYLPIRALLAPAGFVGGIILVLIYDALLASFLYVVSELVRGSPVRLSEMPQSVKHYFWPIMNVLFVLWIAELLASPLFSQANGPALLFAIEILLLVLLNAVPEVIYLRGTYGGLAAIQGGISFIHQHWLEWFIPNVPIFAALWFGQGYFARLPFGFVLMGVVLGALIHVAMVFRGFLFQALDGTTARQRDLRYRLGR